jgi:hypothetical protein
MGDGKDVASGKAEAQEGYVLFQYDSKTVARFLKQFNTQGTFLDFVHV